MLRLFCRQLSTSALPSPAARILSLPRKPLLPSAAPLGQTPTSSLSRFRNTLESLSETTATDALLFVLAHPNLTKLALPVADSEKLLELMLGRRNQFALSAQHFNLLLTHLLKDYIDAVQIPYQPVKNPKPSRTSKVLDAIPQPVIDLANRILSQMQSLDIQPDGWTLSLEILVHKLDGFQKLHSLWLAYLDPHLKREFQKSHYSNLKKTASVSDSALVDKDPVYKHVYLQPWAYNILIFEYSRPFRDGVLMFDEALNPNRVVSFWKRDQMSTQEQPTVKPSTSMIWQVYTHMKKMKLEPTLATHELLLRSMLSVRPLDFKAIRKARSKLIVGNKGSKLWSVGAFEAVMEAIAEIGSEEEVVKLMRILHSKKIVMTRSLTDSLLKFYSLSGNPERVLELYKTIQPMDTPPTYTTYAAVLHSIIALPEHHALMTDTLFPEIMGSLASPTAAKALGPATFDALISSLSDIKSFDMVRKGIEGFVKDVVPVWKRGALFGFNETEGGLVFARPVLEAACAAYGAARDKEAMFSFFKQNMGTRRVIDFYGTLETDHSQDEGADQSVFDSCYKEFAMEWLDAEGSEEELEHVLIELRSIVKNAIK
ncbi:hypothetical protein BDR26DRAFT_283557 [Obelidium mucronatum]|nr:hypothetical protein BDR26DRAFT_283557 [Obelidium mucronatum]